MTTTTATTGASLTARLDKAQRSLVREVTRQYADPAYQNRVHALAARYASPRDVPDELIAPTLPRPLEGPAPAGLLDALGTIVCELGFSLAYLPGLHRVEDGLSTDGVTVHDTSSVVIRADMSEAAQAHALAHELAHVLGIGDDHGEDDWALVEVEAESFSYVVCTAAGMPAVHRYTALFCCNYMGHGANCRAVIRTAADKVREPAGIVLGMLEAYRSRDDAEPA